MISSGQENTTTHETIISHPLADINDIRVSSTDKLDSFEEDHPLTNSTTKPTGKLVNNSSTGGSGTPPPRPKVQKPGSDIAHGLCLTLSDHDRLRIFIHEFVVRGLLPYIEKMIRTLNEQVRIIA